MNEIQLCILYIKGFFLIVHFYDFLYCIQFTKLLYIVCTKPKNVAASRSHEMCCGYFVLCLMMCVGVPIDNCIK